MKKTKIICTIGPSTYSREMLRIMMENGMDVARINMSHATRDEARNIIYTIRELNRELKMNVGILIDTKGPELTLKAYSDEDTMLCEGDTVVLTVKDSSKNNEKFLVNYPGLIQDVKKGDKILLEEGTIELVVVDETIDDVICEVVTGGCIKNDIGLNVPDVNLNIDFLSIADKSDITFASSIDADYIALSFVRNANDVLDVNDMLIQLRNEHMQIISKIENKSAIEDLNNIIKVSEGIMVARGDLGVETSFEEVPYLQKKIVHESLLSNKICIVATQMLASMEYYSKPTRAEVSDIANAVIDGVDAVMLSGETAVGKYPLETLETMKRIITNMEDNLDYDKFMLDKKDEAQDDITTIIASNVTSSANKLKAKAIVASSVSGYTARMISSFRPRCPIIVTTPEEKTARSLSLNYGTYPVVTPTFESTDEMLDNSINEAKKIIPLENDKIIITGSIPIKANSTNFMKIEEIK
ncbi:MAG: pyruvate kinase [Bacilli bacterium]|nr:pyruvate kinase [Bacilli bacterium]MDD4411601.1 pyruvate kinase [Bacilli bacterium]